MPGYGSQLNQGYNEEPGVNWGKVAAYSVGGVMALGAGKMAYNQARQPNSGFRNKVRQGKAWGARKARATPGWIGEKAKTGAGWAAEQAARPLGFGARLAGVDTLKGFGHAAKGMAVTGANAMRPSSGPARVKKAKANFARSAKSAGSKGFAWATGKDFASHGLKRWGVGGMRVAGALAAADFLNPFSLGFND